MNIKEVLNQYYKIGRIIQVTATEFGSGSSFIVDTEVEKYVVKLNERPDFIKIYDKVQKHLNLLGIRQSRIIPTVEGKLSAQGVVLYEFIIGDTHRCITKIQMENAIGYLKMFNHHLKAVPFSADELECRNHWDKARSLEFLLGRLPEILEPLAMGNYKQVLLDAISLLAKGEKALSSSRQLVHSDLGPDNFLFSGDEVEAIIDFTPDYQHELYSLAQFVYWNYPWSEGAMPDFPDQFLSAYLAHEPDRSTKDLFFLLLIQAALFRITGPLLDQLERDSLNISKLENRFSILEKIVANI